MESIDLKTKLANLEQERINLCHQMIAMEDYYDDAKTEEDRQFAKDNIENINDQLFANSAVIAALNHRLDQKV